MLSDVQIRAWFKTARPVAKSDGNGLTFTLSAKGTAAWVLRYRFAGKARELTLGRYPELSLAEARKRALEARGKVMGGTDVAREKRQVKIERAAAQSFSQLTEDYMAKAFPRLSANTISQRRRHIEQIIVPRLGVLPAREVTTADVVALVETVGLQRSKNVAELVLTAISEIFKHGLARHVVTTNPCAPISAAAIVGKPEPRRKRLMLTEDELRALLPALDRIGEQNALTIKLLLATCARIGELARARWIHVDPERGEWTIPTENAKNRVAFTIPLAPPVVEWFERLRVLSCGSPYVLPARQARRRLNHDGEIHFEQRALNAMIHKLCDRLGGRCRRFTPHDLRSTARSHLAALGIDLIVAERCLNHSLGGLVAVYDQHDYLRERREALRMWASFLHHCEVGKPWKVISLRSVA